MPHSFGIWAFKACIEFVDNITNMTVMSKLERTHVRSQSPLYHSPSQNVILGISKKLMIKTTIEDYSSSFFFCVCRYLYCNGIFKIRHCVCSVPLQNDNKAMHLVVFILFKRSNDLCRFPKYEKDTDKGGREVTFPITHRLTKPWIQ